MKTSHHNKGFVSSLAILLGAAVLAAGAAIAGYFIVPEKDFGPLPVAEVRPQFDDYYYIEVVRGDRTEQLRVTKPNGKTTRALDIVNFTETARAVTQAYDSRNALGASLSVPGNPELGEYANRMAVRLQDAGDALGATNKIPDLRALFETSLASKITTTATSMTLTSATDKDGNTLASSTYAFIIDEGTSLEEMVLADCTATACTNMTRGLSVLTGTSTVTALKKAHGRGASVKITDGPILLILNRILQGVDTFPNLLSYTSGTACTAGSSGTTICDKAFITSQVNAGAATSTETLGGLVELGTLAEQANSTDNGANQPTVLQTKNSTSTCQVVGSYNVVASSTTGKIDKGCVDQTARYTFTGTNTFTATTTMATTTLDQIGVGTTSPSSLFGAAINGDTYITGGLGVGTVSSTTNGSIETSGNVHIGGNLTVVGSVPASGSSFFAPCTKTTTATDGVVNNLREVDSADAAVTNCYGSMVVPTGGTISSIQIVFGSGNTTGNANFDVSFTSYLATASTQTDSVANTGCTDVQPGSTVVLCTLTSTSYDGLTRGKLWDFNMARDAVDAADTTTSALKLFGLMVNITN